MEDDVHFIDTTFRDGSQSNWASNMRFGMMEPIAGDMDEAGFSAIEVPINGILFKKIVRDLKEDPFEMVRMFSAKMPKTAKACMGTMMATGGFGGGALPVLSRLAIQMTADLLMPFRVQSTCNTGDQLVRFLPTQVPRLKEAGFIVALAVSYSLSPRHTDELFAEKTRAAAALAPHSIYLKDQGGLLTVDRVRTLIPIGRRPVTSPSSCTRTARRGSLPRSTPKRCGSASASCTPRSLPPRTAPRNRPYSTRPTTLGRSG